MENSDSGDEDESAAQRQSHIDRLVREEDFYRFVGNLSEEDYKLMRDYNLLGNPGERTEEELQIRLQQIKENTWESSDENTGGGNSSEYMISDAPHLNQFNYFEESESEQELSQFIPDDDFTFSSDMYFYMNNENSSSDSEYAPSTRLASGQNIENYLRPVENLCSVSTFARPSRSEQSIPEALMEGAPTRSQIRERSTSPNHRRTRSRIEICWSPRSMSEDFHRLPQGASSATTEHPLLNMTEMFSRNQAQETLRPQVTGHDLQSWGLSATPGTSNAIQRESYPDTAMEDETWRLTILWDPEVQQVQPGAYSERDSLADRTQVTSETPTNTGNLASEQGGPRHMFPHSEQADMGVYVDTNGVPIHSILHIDLSDTISVSTQSNSWQTMIDFNDSSNLMNSDNNLELSLSFSSQNMERAESPPGTDSPDSSRSFGSNSSPNRDSRSPCLSITISNSNYMPSYYSSGMSGSSSSDETADVYIQMYERISSLGSPSETRQYHRPVTPVSFDDFDSLASDLGQSDDDSQPTGLAKEQIDNLAVRYFGENDVSKTCSICFMEYSEGNRIRVLPCYHEYHIHCIDRWLADYSTCPLCRGKVIDSGEEDNSN